MDLQLYIENGNSTPLSDIVLQTCAYLRAIKEFADFTTENKFVHLPGNGWVTLSEAGAMQQQNGRYRVGWRKEGKKVADCPMIVTLSNQAERLVAMTWFQDTLSMVSNPRHPCMHADPQFADLPPGTRASIRGKIVFFEGALKDFDPAKHGVTCG